MKNETIDWNKGATITSILAVIFGIFLGLPMLLSKPEILLTTSIIFYIILYMFATIGHYDDIINPRITKQDVIDTLLGGLISFIMIEVLFMMGLTMLRTPTLAVMTRSEAIYFNLGFVVPGEELIFRDTLPYVLTILLTSINIKGATLGEKNSVIFAFIISSITFGMLHFAAYNLDPVALLQAVIAGIILSFVRIKFGIGASFTGHALFNVMNLLGLFILPT